MEELTIRESWFAERCAGGSTGSGGAIGTGGANTGGSSGTGGVIGTGGANTGGSSETCGTTTGTVGSTTGPGGYCWMTWTDPGGTAQWVTPPSANSAHVSAQGPADGLAGMEALLNAGNAVDLSAYDQLWFDATIPVGQQVAVSIGRGNPSPACSWYLLGAGTTQYAVDITSADYCLPTACGLGPTWQHRRGGAVHPHPQRRGSCTRNGVSPAQRFLRFPGAVRGLVQRGPAAFLYRRRDAQLRARTSWSYGVANATSVKLQRKLLLG